MNEQPNKSAELLSFDSLPEVVSITNGPASKLANADHSLPPEPNKGQHTPFVPPRSLRVFAWINMAVGVMLPIVNYLVVNGSIDKLHSMGLSDSVSVPLWITIWMYAGTGLVVFLAGIGLYQQTLWGRKLALICAGWFFAALFVSAICGYTTLALAQQEYHGYQYVEIKIWYAAPMLTPLYGIITLVVLNLSDVRCWARGVRAVKRGVPPEQAFAPMAETPVSKLAMVSLVCSLIPCMPLPFVAFVTGIIALGKIKKSRGALGGRRLALAGTIISSVTLALIGGLIALGLTLSQLEKDKPSRDGSYEKQEINHTQYP